MTNTTATNQTTLFINNAAVQASEPVRCTRCRRKLRSFLILVKDTSLGEYRPAADVDDEFTGPEGFFGKKCASRQLARTRNALDRLDPRTPFPTPAPAPQPEPEAMAA